MSILIEARQAAVGMKLRIPGFRCMSTCSATNLPGNIYSCINKKFSSNKNYNNFIWVITPMILGFLVLVYWRLMEFSCCTSWYEAIFPQHAKFFNLLITIIALQKRSFSTIAAVYCDCRKCYFHLCNLVSLVGTKILCCPPVLVFGLCHNRA